MPMDDRTRDDQARSGYMPRRRRLGFYVSAAAVWSTGVIWLLVHFLAGGVDEFGFEAPHPGEHWALMAHALSSLLGIWWFGLLWPSHVTRNWRLNANRLSGGWLFAAVIVLMITGYLLYYVSSVAVRSWVSVVHWFVGLVILGLLLAHLKKRTGQSQR